MKRLKRLLARIPGFMSAYGLVRFLAHVIYVKWLVEFVNLQWRMDQAYRRGLWSYEIPRVQERYRRVLACLTRQLGTETWGDILEVGCAEGAFTLLLAERCRSVVACDVSPIACSRAVERCGQYPQVRIQRLNIIRDEIPGQYDLVFAMEVLDTIHSHRRLRKVASKLAGATRKGGLLVFCEYRLPAAIRSQWWSRWFLEGGDNLLLSVRDRFGLHLAHQEIYDAGQSIPGYTGHVIALLKKEAETIMSRD